MTVPRSQSALPQLSWQRFGEPAGNPQLRTESVSATHRTIILKYYLVLDSVDLLRIIFRTITDVLFSNHSVLFRSRRDPWGGDKWLHKEITWPAFTQTLPQLQIVAAQSVLRYRRQTLCPYQDLQLERSPFS